MHCLVYKAICDTYFIGKWLLQFSFAVNKAVIYVVAPAGHKHPICGIFNCWHACSQQGRAIHVTAAQGVPFQAVDFYIHSDHWWAILVHFKFWSPASRICYVFLFWQIVFVLLFWRIEAK
jgi:hypothetical protein